MITNIDSIIIRELPAFGQFAMCALMLYSPYVAWCFYRDDARKGYRQECDWRRWDTEYFRAQFERAQDGIAFYRQALAKVVLQPCPVCGSLNDDNWPLEVNGSIQEGGCQMCWESQTSEAWWKYNSIATPEEWHALEESCLRINEREAA